MVAFFLFTNSLLIEQTLRKRCISHVKFILHMYYRRVLSLFSTVLALTATVYGEITYYTHKQEKAVYIKESRSKTKSIESKIYKQQFGCRSEV